MNQDQFPSPDGHHRIDLYFSEMRMSHWIACPSLCEQLEHRILWQAPWQLSADRVIWSEDSQCVVLEARIYPGQQPPLNIELYPTRGLGKIQDYERKTRKKETPLGTSTDVFYELGEYTFEGTFAELDIHVRQNYDI